MICEWCNSLSRIAVVTTLSPANTCVHLLKTRLEVRIVEPFSDRSQKTAEFNSAVDKKQEDC